MLYTEWVSRVLAAESAADSGRARLVGVPIGSLCDSLGVAYADEDAVEDAIYDLTVLDLVHRRPNSFISLTPAGRLAAAGSIEDVCGDVLRATPFMLTDEERRFVQALNGHSEKEYDLFVRLHYVNVDQIFAEIGLTLTNEEQEPFLLALVEKDCIDYREFKRDRDARPLYRVVATVLPVEAGFRR